MRGVAYHDKGMAPGSLLDEYESKAAKQDDLIKEFFKSWPGGSFTAPDLLHAVKWRNVPPLTSIRRSLCNLADPKRGAFIVKTGMREGVYGRPNGVYKLK